VLRDIYNLIMFTCKVCNLAFGTKMQLVGHHNTHKKEMCYCNVCGKGPFNNKTQLKGHLSVHNRPKIYKKREKIKNTIHLCDFCGNIFETGQKLGGHKVNCLLNPKREERLMSLSESGKKRVLTEEHKLKISISRKKYLDENPGKIPYLLNHSSKESYPEKLFREFLEKNNIIGWKQEYPYKRYSLDFAFPDKKINIEIDGSTHNIESVSNKDKIRDRTLKNDGWIVYRLSTKDVKYNLKEIIKQFNILL
jgi:very-short-patch-repair endonuclease